MDIGTQIDGNLCRLYGLLRCQGVIEGRMRQGVGG